MNGPGPEGAASGRPVEDRLRGAFAARAESITLRDLRPAAPPGPHTRRGRLPGPLRPWLRRLRRLRRYGLPLAAAAATAAVVIGFLATAPSASDRPLPATPPRPVGPAPSPSPTGLSPAPSASHPSRVPSRTAGPYGSGEPSRIPDRPPRPSRPGIPTPRQTEEPGSAPSGTTVTPPTTPSATPTPRRATHAAPGTGAISPSPHPN